MSPECRAGPRRTSRPAASDFRGTCGTRSRRHGGGIRLGHSSAASDLIWHEVWDGRPDELAAAIDAEYDHASWSENFPWTRLEGVALPVARKKPFARPAINSDGAWREAKALGDG